MSFLFRKIVALASPGNLNAQSKERRSATKPPLNRTSHPPPYSPPPPYHVSPDTSPPSLLLAPVHREPPPAPPKTPKIAPKELEFSPAMEKNEKLWEEQLTAETQQYKEFQATGYRQQPMSPWIATPHPAASRDLAYPECKPLSSGSSRSSSVSSLESVESRSSLQSSYGPCTPRTSPLGTPAKSKCRVSFENPTKPRKTYMHPLFAWTRTRPTAPICYDVLAPPPSPVAPTQDGSTIKDFLDQPIPLCTLLEPATEPPTKGKMMLYCQELGWEVPGVCPRKKKFFIDNESACSSDTEDDDDDDWYPGRPSNAVITNLDVLRSIHSSLSLPISQADWTQLSEDDRKDVSKAYRTRCRGAQERGDQSPKTGRGVGGGCEAC
ncbi:hypothetical protein FA13DRAFT_1797379 [Coprinellus micaceus]|uniref:DUF6699 domain-containing protein n=1 Tax=Coprinellus micaceus TaxID=71717 RepID=A0A4Y7SRL5_COPMI|nr:hypothetical protein FA13DRAFT_1797379 [Coprinellus micaceus]